MVFRQCDPREIFGSRNVAKPDMRKSGDRGFVGRKMAPQPCVTASGRAARLIDYGSGIADQLDIVGAELDGDPDGMKQSQPFGFLAPAIADIGLRIGDATHDRRNLHHAGIGTAATVKEDPQTAGAHAGTLEPDRFW
jgi:hypothetical protein